ncbi:MAG: choice-of-anchor J domain-containing protein [Bacteroidales bacterium]|nr:choice-of-anchor J domain-containing protein [Bacteroidales bacterium]
MRKSLKTLGLCALAALAIVSCKKNEQTGATMSFEATINQPTNGTRTEIGPEDMMIWNNGDVIKVFAADGSASAPFTTTADGVPVANFTGQIKDSESYCAFYPADFTSEANGTMVTLTLSANQTFKNGSFSANTYPIAAKSNESDKTRFNFHSPCGLLAIPVKGTGTLGSIELTGKNGEKLAGTYIYDMNGTMTAPVDYTEDANATTVTLTCEGGLELNDTPATMYFVLPDGALSEGFSIHLKDTKGNTLPADHVATNNTQTIEAQNIRTMGLVTVSGTEVHTPEAEPENIGSTSIIMTGSYGDGMNVTEVGFYYRKATEPESANVKVKVWVELANKLANNSFTYTLIGLESGVGYTYKSYVVVSGDQGGTESTGAEQTVTTNTPVSAEVPTLTTANVTVSGTEATVGGTITNVGDGTIVAGGCGIRYKSVTDDWTYVALTPENNAFSTTLTGLTENTTYTVQAYATTNEAGTGYGSKVTFTTELHGVESFTVDFNDGILPEGWTTIDADGDGYNWVLDTEAESAYGTNLSNAGLNETHMIVSASYHRTAGALNPDNYLVSPKVTLNSGSTFSFWACAEDADYAAEHFGVFVSDNGTDGWEMMQEWTMTAKGASGNKGNGRDGYTRGGQGNWYYFSVDLSAHAGQKYIAIRHFNSYDQYFLNVDNIRLGEPVGTTFSQNFNNSVLPEGWTTIDADGDGYNWVLTTQTAAYGYSGHNDGHYGTVGMTSGSYHATVGALTPDNYLVTPKVTLVQGSTFSFWACAQDKDYPAEHFGVYVSDNGTSGWTMVQEWTMTAKGASGNKGNGRDGNTRAIGSWYLYSVDLSAYAGEKYIAIRHFNCSDKFFLEVDDILLTVN